MTRLDLQLLVSGWVDDPDQGYFTPTLINTYLNNALYEIQKRLILAGENFYITCVTTPTVANQQEYALPSDFWGVRRLRLITSGSGITAAKHDLTAISIGQEKMFAKTGTPEAFYLKKDRLVLIPTPTTATFTIEMDYAYQIATMSSDSDVPDVPTHFQEYIALVAAYNCYIKDDRVPTIIQEKKTEYEDQLDEAADARVMTGSRQVIVTPEGFFGNV